MLSMSNPSPALGHPVYEHILEMIMTRQLLPDEKIPENKIAETFGISRTPVREAMRQLANEGLINICPKRFAKVARYSPDEILEIGAMRLSLDTLAVKLCMLHGSQLDFLNLRRIADEIEQAHLANDYALRCKHDMQFHGELANIGKNSLLIKFQKEINLRVQFIVLNYPNAISNSYDSVVQHIEIADALIAHNEKRALEATLKHLAKFYMLDETYPRDFFSYLGIRST